MSTVPGPGETPADAEPRVTLNPKVDPEQARPIPSILPDPGASSEAGAVEAAAPAAAQPAAEVPHEPVEIPRASAALEPELEAEVEAALEGLGSLALDDAGAVASNQGSAVAAVVELAPGAKLTARVQSVLEDCVIVDLGARASGAIPTRQFAEGKLPEPGTNLEVIVAHIDPNDGLIHCGLAKAVVTRPAGDWSAVAEGQIVDCMVTKTNKGGLEVSVSNLRGFLPAGQVDLVFCSNLEQFVGQKLRVKILEVNPQKRNLVVSRRQYLEAAVAEAREEAWKHLQPGQRLTGKVKTIKDYGAFIDIGGVDGLLHVSEISWGRVVHPRDVLAEGQEVEVQILSLDRQKQKISLGMKQLQASPWQQVAEKFPVGAVVRGKVTKTTDFGAFVELEPGLEGMVHISELDHRRVGRVTDVLKVGQEVDVKVLSLDLDKKRIALSVKALLARPEAAKKPGDEELAPGAGAVYERKRKEPLKGGGTGSGGFLFGNPKDR